MVLDIFDWLNNLRTDPVTTRATLSPAAQTNTASFTSSLPAFKWSNALGQAALEFIN